MKDQCVFIPLSRSVLARLLNPALYAVHMDLESSNDVEFRTVNMFYNYSMV